MTTAAQLTPLTPPLLALRVAPDGAECSRSLDSERSSSVVSATMLALAVPRRVSDGPTSHSPLHQLAASAATAASDGDSTIQAPEIEVEHPSVMEGEGPPSLTDVMPPHGPSRGSVHKGGHGMRITVTQPTTTSAASGGLVATGSASFSSGHDDEDDISPRSDVGHSPMEQQHQMSSFVFPTSGATSVMEIPGLQVEGEAQSQLIAAGGLVLGVGSAAPSSSGGGGGGLSSGVPQRFRRLSSSTDTHPNHTATSTAYSVSPMSRTYLSPRHQADVTLTRNSSLTTKRSSFSHSDGILTPLAGSQAPPLRSASFLNLMMVPIPTDLGEESLLDLLRLPVSPRGSLHSSADGSESDMSTVSSLPRKYSGNVTMAPPVGGGGGSLRPQVPSPVGMDGHQRRVSGGNASLSPPSPFPRGGRHHQQRGSDSQHTNSGSFSVSSVGSSVKADALAAGPHSSTVPATAGKETREAHDEPHDVAGEATDVGQEISGGPAAGDDDEMDRAVELLTGFFLEEISSRFAHLSMALDAMAPLRVHHADMLWQYHHAMSQSSATTPTTTTIGGVAKMDGSTTPPMSPVAGVVVVRPCTPSLLPSPRSAAALLRHAMDMAFDSAQEWFTTSMGVYDTILLMPLLRTRDSFPSQHVAPNPAAREAVADAVLTTVSAPAVAVHPTLPLSLQSLFPFDDASWISLIGTIRVGTLVLSTRNFYYGLHVTLLSAFRIQPSSGSVSSSFAAQGSSTTHSSSMHHHSLRSTTGSRRNGSPTAPAPSLSSPPLPPSAVASTTATSSPQNPSGSFHHQSSSSTGTSTTTSPTTTTLPTTSTWQQSVPSLWMSSMTNVFLRTMPAQWLPDIPLAASVSVSFRQTSYGQQQPPPGGSPSSLRAWSIPRGSFSTRRESDGAVSSLLWYQQSSPPHQLGGSGGGGVMQSGAVVAHYSSRGNSLRLSHDDTAAAGHGDAQRRRSSSRRSSSNKMNVDNSTRNAATSKHEDDDSVGASASSLMVQLLLMETSTRHQLEDLYATLSHTTYRWFLDMHTAAPVQTPAPSPRGSNTPYAPPRPPPHQATDATTVLHRKPPPAAVTTMMQFEDLRVGSDDEEEPPAAVAAPASVVEAPGNVRRSCVSGDGGGLFAACHTSSDEASRGSDFNTGSLSFSTQQILDLVDRRLVELGGWSQLMARPVPTSNRRLSHHASEPPLAATFLTGSTATCSFVGDLSSSSLGQRESATSSNSSGPSGVDDPSGADKKMRVGQVVTPSRHDTTDWNSSATQQATMQAEDAHNYIAATGIDNTQPLTPHPPRVHHNKAQQRTSSPVSSCVSQQNSNASPANTQYNDGVATRSIAVAGEEVMETDAGRTHVVRTVRPPHEQRLRHQENIFDDASGDKTNTHDFVAAIFRLRRNLLADIVDAERNARRCALEAESAGRYVLMAAQHSPARLADACVYFFCAGLPWHNEGITEENLARILVASNEASDRRACLGGYYDRLAVCLNEGQRRTAMEIEGMARWSHLRDMYEALFDGYLTVHKGRAVDGSSDASRASASSPPTDIDTTPPSPVASNGTQAPNGSLPVPDDNTQHGSDDDEGPSEQRPDTGVAAPVGQDGAAWTHIVQQAEYCAAVIFAEASHAASQLTMWSQRDFLAAARRETTRRHRQAVAARLVDLVESQEPAARTAVSNAWKQAASIYAATFRRVAYAMAPPALGGSEHVSSSHAHRTSPSQEQAPLAVPLPLNPPAEAGQETPPLATTASTATTNEDHIVAMRRFMVVDDECTARMALQRELEVDVDALLCTSLHLEADASRAAVEQDEQAARSVLLHAAASSMPPPPLWPQAPAPPAPPSNVAAPGGLRSPRATEHNVLSSDDDSRDDSNRNTPSTMHNCSQPLPFVFDTTDGGAVARRLSAAPGTPHIAAEEFGSGPMLTNASTDHDDASDAADGVVGASLHAGGCPDGGGGGGAFDGESTRSDENETHWWDHQQSQMVVQRSAPLAEDANLTHGHRLPFDDVWFLFVVEVQKVKSACIDALTRGLTTRGHCGDQQQRPHHHRPAFHAAIEQGPGSVLRAVLPQLQTSWVDSCTAVLGVPDASAPWTALMLSTMTRSPFALQQSDGMYPSSSPTSTASPSGSAAPSSPSRMSSLLGCGSEDAYLGEWTGACHRHGNGLYEYATGTTLSTTSPTTSNESSAVPPGLIVTADSEHPVPVVKDMYVGRWQHNLRHGSGFYVRVTKRSTDEAPVRTPPASPPSARRPVAKLLYQTTVVFGDWDCDELVKLRWYGSKETNCPCECV